jgi:streptogramin lyase
VTPESFRDSGAAAFAQTLKLSRGFPLPTGEQEIFMHSTRRFHHALLHLCFIAAVHAAVFLPNKTFAAAGELYVAGPQNQVVSKIGFNGTITTFAGDFKIPSCVRFDRSGNAYVADEGFNFDGRIFKITPAGERSVLIPSPGGSGGASPRSLAIDGSGNLYVANNGPSLKEIRKYTLNGAFVSVLATLPSFIGEIACDTSGNVYATSGSSLYRVTPAGAVTTVISFNGTARGVTVDPAGNIFVASSEDIIRKFPPGGGFSVVATNVPQAQNLTTDASGNLYSTSRTGVSFDDGETFIYKFTPSGVRTTVATVSRAGGLDGFKGMAIEPPRGKALNISTRLRVETGDDALIGGFIITGTAGKRVILRALGPSLANAGVEGALQDPVLELYDSNGTFVNGNDNWKSQNQAGIEATGVPPTDDRESALLINLAVSNWTAVVRGKNDTTGVGLVEVYDLDQAADSQLANISTRGRVETAENVMIGGLIIGGNGARGIVRALGPSLAQAGVSGVLSDPQLSLRDANGTEIARNNDWKSDQQAEIQATGVAPANDRESAVVRYFAPGNYTAIVSGNLNATGVGLVEFYNLQ